MEMDADNKPDNAQAANITHENGDVPNTKENKSHKVNKTRKISQKTYRVNGKNTKKTVSDIDEITKVYSDPSTNLLDHLMMLITKGHKSNIGETTIRTYQVNNLVNTEVQDANMDEPPPTKTPFENIRVHINVQDKTEHDSSSNMSPIEIESLELCLMAYKYGFDPGKIKLARLEYTSSVFNLCDSLELENMIGRHSVHVLGSRSEGIHILDSDTDVMISLNSLVCYDTEDDAPTDKSKYAVIYQAHRENSPPGYAQIAAHPCHLCLHKCCNCQHKLYLYPMLKDTDKMKMLFVSIPNLLQSKHLSNNGPANSFSRSTTAETILHFLELYFSNQVHIVEKIHKLFIEMDEIMAQLGMFSNLSDSIIKTLKKEFDVKYDLVFGIPFCSTTIMQKWVNRKRKYGWPSTELIAEIKQMDGHLVPVGLKGSATENGDWRISYALAESKLIKSLKEEQFLVYIFVKRIVKNLKCEDLDSYRVKNLTLWIAEAVDPKHFTMGNLWHLIYVTITLLRNCVARKELPSYMIPEKNLFLHKLGNTKDYNSVLQDLNEVIEHLPTVFYTTEYKILKTELHKEPFTTMKECFAAKQTLALKSSLKKKIFLSKVKLIFKIIMRYNLLNENTLEKLFNFILCSTLQIPVTKCQAITRQQIRKTRKKHKTQLNSKKPTDQKTITETNTDTASKRSQSKELPSSTLVQFKKRHLKEYKEKQLWDKFVHEMLDFSEPTQEVRGRCPKRKSSIEEFHTAAAQRKLEGYFTNICRLCKFRDYGYLYLSK